MAIGKIGKYCRRFAIATVSAVSVLLASVAGPMPAMAADLALQDVNNNTPHYEDVRWLASSGITAGYQDGKFHGNWTVVRQDMAAFLYRMAGSPAFDVNKAGHPFTDVTSRTPHYKEILWLASTGIAKGWAQPDGSVTFGGMRAVVRQDMAAFLNRFAGRFPDKVKLSAHAQVTFSDVNQSTPHVSDIHWLASTGVTVGWTVGNRTEFRGMHAVLRQDMAAFLHRMKGGVAGINATDALATLPIKERNFSDYDRDQFGVAWADVDHNGCDTRNDILGRDLTQVTYKANTHDCVVLSGTLADPYTGRTINFRRGQNTSTEVQIDHVVALSDAWHTGANALTSDQRQTFANDPYNLLAVDGPTNEEKSDGNAADWLPYNQSFRCEYVARQIGVKSKYSLWITQSEHDAMASVLATCPSQTVPDNGGVRTRPAQNPNNGGSSQPDEDEVYYKNCAAVRAAGKAPLYRGQPGYRPGLDRDGDGIACE